MSQEGGGGPGRIRGRTEHRRAGPGKADCRMQSQRRAVRMRDTEGMVGPRRVLRRRCIAEERVAVGWVAEGRATGTGVAGKWAEEGRVTGRWVAEGVGRRMVDRRRPGWVSQQGGWGRKKVVRRKGRHRRAGHGMADCMKVGAEGRAVRGRETEGRAARRRDAEAAVGRRRRAHEGGSQTGGSREVQRPRQQ